MSASSTVVGCVFFLLIGHAAGCRPDGPVSYLWFNCYRLCLHLLGRTDVLKNDQFNCLVGNCSKCLCNEVSFNDVVFKIDNMYIFL